MVRNTTFGRTYDTQGCQCSRHDRIPHMARPSLLHRSMSKDFNSLELDNTRLHPEANPMPRLPGRAQQVGPILHPTTTSSRQLMVFHLRHSLASTNSHHKAGTQLNRCQLLILPRLQVDLLTYPLSHSTLSKPLRSTLVQLPSYPLSRNMRSSRLPRSTPVVNMSRHRYTLRN